MTRPTLLPRIACAVLLATGVSSALALPPSGDWRFTALLDGQPIGTHRFVLANAGDQAATLRSEARFDVTLLGLTLYRYRHRVTEEWRGNCLESISADTDDDGKTTTLRGRREPDGRFALELGAPEGAAAQAPAGAPSCLMSFAYWNPALAGQQRLLDPGSGRIETVTITPLPESELEVQGRATPVRGLRIAGLPRPIDVWYAGMRWVGLDTTVAGGRRLSYRLR